MQVTCRACYARMILPEAALGKKARCPRCSEKFMVEPSDIYEETREPVHAETPPPVPPVLPEVPRQPPPPSGPQFPKRSARRLRAQAPENDFFAPERKALQGGVIGGIALMVIAAIWFIVGWNFGYIYYYPPILFLIGLVGALSSVVKPTPRSRPSRGIRR